MRLREAMKNKFVKSRTNDKEIVDKSQPRLGLFNDLINGYESCKSSSRSDHLSCSPYANLSRG